MVELGRRKERPMLGIGPIMGKDPAMGGFWIEMIMMITVAIIVLSSSPCMV